MSLTVLSAIAPPSLAADVMTAQHEAELTAIANARGISVMEASTRDQFRQRAQPLYDAVTADPNNFAGIYSTDDGGRWRIVVRYVGDAPPSGIKALVAADIPVDWVPARYSMARLNEVFGELRFVLASAIAAKRVSQITPDEASNTVLVGFPQEDPDLQKTLTET